MTPSDHTWTSEMQAFDMCAKNNKWIKITTFVCFHLYLPCSIYCSFFPIPPCLCKQKQDAKSLSRSAHNAPSGVPSGWLRSAYYLLVQLEDGTTLVWYRVVPFLIYLRSSRCYCSYTKITGLSANNHSMIMQIDAAPWWVPARHFGSLGVNCDLLLYSIYNSNILCIDSNKNATCNLLGLVYLLYKISLLSWQTVVLINNSMNKWFFVSCAGGGE